MGTPTPVDYQTTVATPPHYLSGAIEHCEYVEDRGWADGYYPGQVTKYLHRAGLKPGQAADTDLFKAQWYMNRWMAWRTYGRKIWKVKATAPEVTFRPDPLGDAAPAQSLRSSS